MKNTMKISKNNLRACLIGCSLLLIVGVAPISAKANQVVAAATFKVGKVFYVRKGKLKRVKVGTIFRKGDRIFTKKGRVNIQLEKTTIIRLSNFTELNLKNLYKQGDVKKISLFLAKGQLFGKVMKKLNSKSSLRVYSPTSVAGIRGTEFLLSENNGDVTNKTNGKKIIATGLYVTKGKVAFSKR